MASNGHTPTSLAGGTKLSRITDAGLPSPRGDGSAPTVEHFGPQGPLPCRRTRLSVDPYTWSARGSVESQRIRCRPRRDAPTRTGRDTFFVTVHRPPGDRHPLESLRRASDSVVSGRLILLPGPCDCVIEEVVPVNESTWVLLDGDTVGR